MATTARPWRLATDAATDAPTHKGEGRDARQAEGRRELDGACCDGMRLICVSEIAHMYCEQMCTMVDGFGMKSGCEAGQLGSGMRLGR